jgi:hypothetical protein
VVERPLQAGNAGTILLSPVNRACLQSNGDDDEVMIIDASNRVMVSLNLEGTRRKCKSLVCFHLYRSKRTINQLGFLNG